MKIFSGTVSHKHGTDTFISPTEDRLYAKIYDYVVGEWNSVFPGLALPEAHCEAISYYFNNCQQTGEEDNLGDIGPTEMTVKLHCIVINDPDANSASCLKVFLGQTREEACLGANGYMLGHLPSEAKVFYRSDLSDEENFRKMIMFFRLLFDGEVEV